MNFKKTLIIGLGLIGGSFAKALKKHKISNQIFACDLNSEVIEFASSGGIIDGGFDDLEYFSDEISNFDLIVLASPLSSYEDIFSQLEEKISSAAIIIDLGSIKDLKIKNLPKNFIPCHPIAGSQNSGFEHSSADLFQDKKFVICSQNPEAKKIVELVKKIGAQAEFLDAKKHDEIYALVSHLPQFLSFLTSEFSPKNIKDEFFKNAFRLDDSDPELWSEIFEMNEENLEKFYLKFFENLEKNVAISNPLEHAKFLTLSVCHPREGGEGKLPFFDEKFLETNFAAIFFRALVVKSLLEIPQIKTFQNYTGSGFKDFTSIIEIVNYDQKKLADLIEKNRAKILKIFNSVS